MADERILATLLMELWGTSGDTRLLGCLKEAVRARGEDLVEAVPAVLAEGELPTLGTESRLDTRVVEDTVLRAKLGSLVAEPGLRTGV